MNYNCTLSRDGEVDDARSGANFGWVHGIRQFSAVVKNAEQAENLGGRLHHNNNNNKNKNNNNNDHDDHVNY